jgi:DNA-binding transcriptional ArsR family regulator
MSSFLQEGDYPQSSNTAPKTNLLKTLAPSLDHLNIKKASLTFRAINHPLRQDMIRMIDSKGHVTVTELFVEMRLEQSVASQHLAILRRAGLVKKERDGKFMYYKLNLEKLQLLNKMITELLK